jgi:hypothetical protein
MQEENRIIQSPCFFELADKLVAHRPSRAKLGLKDWANLKKNYKSSPFFFFV